MQDWMSSVLMAVQVISSLLIIGLVLLQQGKGADMGSAFGGGSAGSVFGAVPAAVPSATPEQSAPAVPAAE